MSLAVTGVPTDRPSVSRLDRFLPRADVRERHAVFVAAPPERVLDAARRLELRRIPAVAAIFRLRELLLGSRGGPSPARGGLVAETLALGWGVLEEEAGRFFCAGAVCRPWLADVVFVPLKPEAFRAFAEPGWVRIAWTLEAEPRDGGTLFSTETRVCATDAEARTRFRRYWRLVRPGVVLIRRLMLRALVREAKCLKTGPPGPNRPLIRLHHSPGGDPGP